MKRSFAIALLASLTLTSAAFAGAGSYRGASTRGVAAQPAERTYALAGQTATSNDRQDRWVGPRHNSRVAAYRNAN